MERSGDRMRWEDGLVYALIPVGIYPVSTPPGRSSASSESLIFVLIVVSLIRLEFLPDRRKSFLLCALALAIFTFSILAMGQNVVGETSGVAELFLYAGATGVLFGLVLLMPPYRPPNWISGRGTS